MIDIMINAILQWSKKDVETINSDDRIIGDTKVNFPDIKQKDNIVEFNRTDFFINNTYITKGRLIEHEDTIESLCYNKEIKEWEQRKLWTKDKFKELFGNITYAAPPGYVNNNIKNKLINDLKNDLKNML